MWRLERTGGVFDNDELGKRMGDELPAFKNLLSELCYIIRGLHTSE